MKDVKFHGPTIFSDVINIAVEYAKHALEEGEDYLYFILLILTDGVINDMQ